MQASTGIAGRVGSARAARRGCAPAAQPRERALATHLLAFGFVVKKKLVVVVGSVDPGDKCFPRSPGCLLPVTGPVRGQCPAGDGLWTAALSPPDASRLPPGSRMLSSSCPKRVHRDIHSLCVPIVTDGTDTWRLTLTVPAA